MPQGSIFFPHISLAYKQPGTFNAEEISEKFDRGLLKPTNFNRLVLMETSGQAGDWHLCCEFPACGR